MKHLILISNLLGLGLAGCDTVYSYSTDLLLDFYLVDKSIDGQFSIDIDPTWFPLAYSPSEALCFD